MSPSERKRRLLATLRTERFGSLDDLLDERNHDEYAERRRALRMAAEAMPHDEKDE